MRIYLPDVTNVPDLVAGDFAVLNGDRFKVLVDPRNGNLHFRFDEGFRTPVYIRKPCGSINWTRNEFIEDFPNGIWIII